MILGQLRIGARQAKNAPLSSTYYLSLPLLISSWPILTHTYLKSLATLTFKIMLTFLIICLSFFNFYLIPFHCAYFASYAYISHKSTPFQFAKIAKAWRLFTFMSHFRISMTIRPGVYCPITLSRNEPFNLDWGEPIGGTISILEEKIVL